MAIAPFPHVYKARLENTLLVSDRQAPILVGSPPQFGGTDVVWSPEELLVAAALTCLKTTFEAYAKHAGITVADWRGTGTGTLVKAHGGPVFDSIDLDVDVVTTPGDEEKARGLLAKAELNCIISRALNVPVHLTSTVTSEPSRAAG